MTTTTNGEVRLAVSPVASDERIEVLDVLRAFALFGILLVNFPGALGGPLPGANARVDEGLRLLVSGSFYPLFSFLFGLGFAVQFIRAERGGRGASLLFFRRLLAMFLIGTAHAVLIWPGDIVASYALIGLLLIPIHRLAPRTILSIALVLLLLGLVFVSGFRDVLAEWRPTADWVQSRDQIYSLGPADQSEQARILGAERLARGDGRLVAFQLAVENRAYQYTAGLYNELNPIRFLEGGANTILFAFLIGLYVGRRRLLEDLSNRRRGLFALLMIGLAAALTGYAYSRLTLDWGRAAAEIFGRAGNWGPTPFYVASICLLVADGGVPARALRWIAPAGRMGLTNYVVQSLVMTLVFVEPYGLSLTNPGRTLMLGVHGALFFLVQVPLSHWWLARYQFGPAEWLWRSLTYGRAQPMLRRT
jgi:uncharacterized protein